MNSNIPKVNYTLATPMDELQIGDLVKDMWYSEDRFYIFLGRNEYETNFTRERRYIVFSLTSQEKRTLSHRNAAFRFQKVNLDDY